jgi:hypothetical protein
MTNAQEKRVKRIAELKGFRLGKGGHGKGHGRFYIMDLAEGGRMRSSVPDHEYSFSLDEAEAWLAAGTIASGWKRRMDGGWERRSKGCDLSRRTHYREIATDHFVETNPTREFSC